MKNKMDEQSKLNLIFSFFNEEILGKCEDSNMKRLMIIAYKMFKEPELEPLLLKVIIESRKEHPDEILISEEVEILSDEIKEKYNSEQLQELYQNISNEEKKTFFEEYVSLLTYRYTSSSPFDLIPMMLLCNELTGNKKQVKESDSSESDELFDVDTFNDDSSEDNRPILSAIEKIMKNMFEDCPLNEIPSIFKSISENGRKLVLTMITEGKLIGVDIDSLNIDEEKN